VLLIDSIVVGLPHPVGKNVYILKKYIYIYTHINIDIHVEKNTKLVMYGDVTLVMVLPVENLVYVLPTLSVEVITRSIIFLIILVSFHFPSMIPGRSNTCIYINI